MLVLDGDERASLAVTRSLVRAGCAVTVAAPDRWSIAALDAGLGIEETSVIASAGDGAPGDPRLYPGVVKPHRSVIGGAARERTTAPKTSSIWGSLQLAIDAGVDFPVLLVRSALGLPEQPPTRRHPAVPDPPSRT